ncbi:MAG: isoleucine--tRNA ligase [Planctomycetes bacterium]|nr:isoleucine--tRNA ligase [Planctomycetota bacterium]
MNQEKQSEEVSQSTRTSFPQLEEEVLQFWDRAQIFNKSVNKEAPQGEYVFFEGPPTANGMPGIHHVLARSFKDVLPRYKTMNGYCVKRKAGWDTHGLPVELQVEKELNISGKPDIEKYGIEAFNKKCRESVWKFKDEWEKLTKRTAFWVDLNNPYITYENNYIESIWNIIKQVYDKGLIYKGHKVVPHCPRCGTALSSHEVAQGYKLVKDRSVYIKFEITKGNNVVQPGEMILAWTTTPWTLPGNVALAIGKNIDYVKIKHEVTIKKEDSEEVIKGVYILAKERLSSVVKEGSYEVISELKGSDLIGVEYKPLFNIAGILNSGKKAHYVAEADFVTTTDGTGVVHTAVMYGEDDYSLGEKIDLPKVHSVTEEGKFTEDLASYELAGKFVKDKDTEGLIMKYLKVNHLLFAQEMYDHDYPFCWRCDTPLLYYAKDSWFIKMSALKDKLIANNEKINWIPEHIKEGRFGEWLNNIKDWAISRERYWGAPLPIWECEKCGQIKCVGSCSELEKELPDLHKPYIDEVKFTCVCGGQMIRDKAVLDVWFDSGSMPFSQHHYPFENKELIDNNLAYPADYICEAIDQTRGWFYTLLAISTLLDKGAPYKNVICLGHINDKLGKKMSKSKGNVISPWDVINQFGVDAVRMHMYTLNQPGEGKRYDLEDVKEVFRKNIMLLWNVYTFYKMYADQASEQMAFEVAPESHNVLDKWIIAKLNMLTQKISEELNVYHVYESAREIPEFINELSTWYIRRSRDRFKGDDEKDKLSALRTTGFILLRLSKLMAPFMPFMSETLWQKMSGHNLKEDNRSVHLEEWPKIEHIDSEVLEKMELVRKIVELGLAERDKSGIKIRQMLSKTIIHSTKSLESYYLELVRDELNVQEVELVSSDGALLVSLDTELTPELKREGLKRELVRFINMLRKEAGFTLQDRAKISISGFSINLKEMIASLEEEIKKDTLSNEINLVSDLINGTFVKEVKIEEEQIIISIEKI